MEKAELMKLSAEALGREVESLKKELFNLKMSRMSGQIKDFSQFRKIRVKIAQCLTLLNVKNKI